MFKTIFSAGATATAVLVIYLVGSYFFSEPDYVTSARFEEAHKELTAKIDSVSVKVDSTLVKLGVVERKVDVIDAKITNMEQNIDSLKYGQRIIYNEVRKTKKSFEQKFFDNLFK